MKKFWTRKVALLLIALLVLLVFYLASWKPVDFATTGTAMAPTIKKGETVHLERRAYRNAGAVKRFDIVAIDYDIPMDENKKMLRRVIGLPGETVEITTNNTLRVDGVELTLPPGIAALYRGIAPVPATLGGTNPVTCEKDEFYLLGDNPAESWDSRSFGAVPFMRIHGRIQARH